MTGRSTILLCLKTALLRSISSFIPSSAVMASHSNDNEPLLYGVLNYRTGKLDDGTDPCGWYTLD